MGGNISLLMSILAFAVKIHGTHFRGGIITWKHTGSQVEITYRLSFRRGAFGNHGCDDTTIRNNELVSGEGSLACFSGCSGNIVDKMDYYCTDYSVGEDWTSGERTITYIFTTTSDNIFYFGYQSCCWITLVEGGTSANWAMLTTANLTKRQDTGKINTSPISAMQPIARFKYGCSYTLKIPVDDEDGDIVKCRWSNNNKNNECGDVCNSLSGSVLDEIACTLKYSATGNTGWYAVALQIEDFASAQDTQPLSSVTLQFMVYVFTTIDSCDDRPVILNLTNVNGSVATVAVNTAFFQTIIANSGSTSVSITEINTVSPIGMIKSELLPYGTSGTAWHVNVTWNPSPHQTGTHIFCYTAINNIGQASDQVCIDIEVDDIDFCEGVTCENGGTCVDVVITYNCTCPASHTGRHCEIDIDFCEDVTCHNGGTCIDGLFDYYCTCPLTHKGAHCETESYDTGYIVSVISVSAALITCGAITVLGLVKYIKPSVPKIGSNSDVPFMDMDSGHAYG